TAYEEALNLIQVDKKERLQMLERVDKEIARVKKGTPAQLSALNALKFDLQVKSELNDPEIQRSFSAGNLDMGRPVYRYMRQRQFEKAPRTQLLQRITQMNVIPDLLPLDLEPTVQVNINLKGEEGAVEPGVFVKPAQTIEIPKVDVTNFHTDKRLYTLALVDPDSPDVANKTYQQHCHWLITNVPLSATESTVAAGDSVLEYVPPHPQKGTKYHRYTLIAYEQPNGGNDKVDIKVESREAFDIKALAQAHGLEPRGVSFFRQVWDETVSSIYNDILHTHEPVYGKPPKPQRYIRRAVYY
ncbi:phosphatidylethanolamine-binding protein, partial [Fennellomyces sp. T-0311]